MENHETHDDNNDNDVDDDDEKERDSSKDVCRESVVVEV
jgi:hypothetical protein